MECSTNIFIKKAKATHGDQYDYSNVAYVNSKTKVQIICPKHGAFEQTPDKHVNGKCGCPMCAGNVRLSKQTFIEKAIAIHGNKYCYDDVQYVNSKQSVKIGCTTHGIFEQSPNNHLRGKGCPYCSGNVTATLNQFIQKAEAVHGKVYNYSQSVYVNNRTPVQIGCTIHGLFSQKPYVHLSGAGCPICGHLKQIQDHDYKASYQKAIQTFQTKYKVNNPMDLPAIRERHKQIVSSDEVNQKRLKTKRQNGSFNTSLVEYKLSCLLKAHFGDDDVEHNYKSEEYPYLCDFYIKSRHLYIELNAHWSHGKHWYNADTDAILINEWKNKSRYHQNAAVTFSERDVIKREISRQNCLNYVVFWTNDLSDARLWFELGCPDGHDWLKEYSWKK